jgi:hypothetical protein
MFKFNLLMCTLVLLCLFNLRLPTWGDFVASPSRKSTESPKAKFGISEHYYGGSGSAPGIEGAVRVYVFVCLLHDLPTLQSCLQIFLPFITSHPVATLPLSSRSCSIYLISPITTGETTC